MKKALILMAAALAALVGRPADSVAFDIDPKTGEVEIDIGDTIMVSWDTAWYGYQSAITAYDDTGSRCEVLSRTGGKGYKIWQPRRPGKYTLKYEVWSNYDAVVMAEVIVLVNGKYSVVFDANGGRFGDGTAHKVQQIDAMEWDNFPDDPQQEGYTFKGWWTALDGGYEIVPESQLNYFYLDTVAPPIVYAHWEGEEVRLTFNGGPGSVVEGSWNWPLISNDRSSAKWIGRRGSRFGILPEATLAGMDFVCWSACDYDNRDAISEHSVIPDSDTTYYAVWAKRSDKFTIVFDANEGKIDIWWQDYRINESQVEISYLPTPIREGYIFDGWYAGEWRVSKGDVTLSFLLDAAGLDSSAKKMTLVARWRNPVFRFDGSSKGIIKVNGVTKDHVEREWLDHSDLPDITDMTVSPASGNELWFAGFEDVYKRKYYAVDGKGNLRCVAGRARQVAKWMPSLLSRELSIGDAILLSQIWAKDVALINVNPYLATVKKSLKMATASSSSAPVLMSATTEAFTVRVVANEPIGGLPVPSQEGYDFDGYWTSPEGGIRITEADVLMKDETLDAYGRWLVATNTVMFELGEHGVWSGGGALTQRVEYAAAAAAPTVEAKAGWVFKGWDIDYSSVIEDMTVTALYQEYFEPSVASEAFADAVENVPYSFQLEVAGGEEPYMWEVVADGYESSRQANSFAEIGEAQGWGSYWSSKKYTLPFEFTFYGETYGEVYVNENGTLSFGRSFTSSSPYSWSSYLNGVPFIAPEWDWTTSDSNRVHVAATADAVTFRWDVESVYGRCRCGFSATLQRDGTIRFSYGSGKSSYSFAGVSAGDGVRYVAVATRNTGGIGSRASDVVLAPMLVASTVGLPMGLSLSSSGLLSGIPKESATNAVTVRVTDSLGEAAVKTFDLRVAANPNTRPVADAVSPAETNGHVYVVAGKSRTFTVDARDPEGAPLEYRWFVDGEWTSNDVGSASFTYSPTTEDAFFYSHSVSCVVSDGFWTNDVAVVWKYVIVGKTIYVDANSSADEDSYWEEGFGLTPDNAYPSIAMAMDRAYDGDEIVVAPGIYQGFYARCSGLTVRSLEGPEKTVIDGGESGFCVEGGYQGWSPDSDSYGESEADMFKVVGFTLWNATGSSAARRAVLEDCIVRDCAYLVAEGSILRNCLVYGNGCPYEYGLQSCKLVNCTVAGNTVGEAMINSECRAYNSIIWGNHTSTGGEANYEIAYDYHAEEWVYNEETGMWEWITPIMTNLFNCCTSPEGAPGENTVSSDPLLVDVENGDLRLRAGSPCRDAGLGAYVETECDLGGNARVQGAAPDIGAYEGTAVEGLVLSTRVVGNGTVTPMTAMVEEGSSVVFTADDSQRTFLYFETNGVFATDQTTFTWLNVQADGVVTAVFSNYTFHVDAVTGNDANDGLSWATAKASIQSAVDASVDGEVIWVADGIYGPIATENKKIRIESMNGAEAAIIDGGYPAVTNRCATFSETSGGTNTFLVGFTLRNGCAIGYGGGSYGGTLRNCIVSNCYAVSGTSWSAYGGGLYYGVAENCLIVSNMVVSSEDAYGGGTCRTKVTKCVVADNAVIAGNSWSCSAEGGGLYYGTAVNCLIVRNTVRSGGWDADGGGAYGASLYHCTIADNTATYTGTDTSYGAAGGGIASSSSVYNSVIYGNMADGVANEVDRDSWLSSYGNLYSANPLFVDAANGNYRLAKNSPAIDIGMESYTRTDTDLDDHPRLQWQGVDAGAYEADPPPAEDVFAWVKTGRDSVTIVGLADETLYPKIKHLAIPSELDGKRVTGIAWMGECGAITSITVSASVTSITSGAFDDCIRLKTFAVETGSWSYWAENGLLFSDDGLAAVPQGLSEIKIPAYIEVLDGDAIAGNTNLTSILVDVANPTFSSVDGIVYSKDGRTLWMCPPGRASVVIADGVSTIGDLAFWCCANLGRITVPSGVTNIGQRAFGNCETLRFVTLPRSLASIGRYAFMGCSSLERIQFSGNAPALSNAALTFTDVAATCTVFVPFGSTGWGVDIPGSWNGLQIAYADILPELPGEASPLDVATVLAYSADAAVRANVTNVAVYADFRTWALAATNASGAAAGAAAVMASDKAWFSFAVASPMLVEKEIVGDDVQIEKFGPSPSAGSYDLIVSVKDVEIGSAATAERLKSVFGIEGAATLKPAAFSGEKVDIELVQSVNGKVKFIVQPKGTGDSFFMCVKVRP